MASSRTYEILEILYSSTDVFNGPDWPEADRNHHNAESLALVYRGKLFSHTSALQLAVNGTTLELSEGKTCEPTKNETWPEEYRSDVEKEGDAAERAWLDIEYVLCWLNPGLTASDWDIGETVDITLYEKVNDPVPLAPVHPRAWGFGDIRLSVDPQQNRSVPWTTRQRIRGYEAQVRKQGEAWPTTDGNNIVEKMSDFRHVHHDPTDGATYEFRVRAVSLVGKGAWSRTFSVVASDTDPDYTFDGHTTTVTGMKGEMGDEDTISVDLVGGTTYTINYAAIRAPDTPHVMNNYRSLLPTVLIRRAHQPRENWTLFRCCYPQDSREFEVPTGEGGKYEIVISSATSDSNGKNGAGYYRVTLEGLDGTDSVDEHESSSGSCQVPLNDPEDTTCGVAPGTTVHGTLAGGTNLDTWAVRLDAVQPYIIEARFTGTVPSDAQIQAYTVETGNTIEKTATEQADGSVRIKYALERSEAGLRYIRVSGENAPANAPYAVTVTIVGKGMTPESGDCADTKWIDCSLLVRTSTTGELSTGSDKDRWMVYLSPRRTYEMNVQGDTLADPKMELHRLDGTRVASNDNTEVVVNTHTPKAKDVRLVHRITSGNQGLHYVTVSSGNNPNGGGTYTLEVQLEDGYTHDEALLGDCLQNEDTGCRIVLGDTGDGTIDHYWYLGNISTRDHDFWGPIHLRKGNTYVITVTGTGDPNAEPPENLPQGRHHGNAKGQILPKIKLRMVDGLDDNSATRYRDVAQGSQATTSNPVSMITYKIHSDGRVGYYYIEIEGANRPGGGPYTVHIQKEE